MRIYFDACCLSRLTDDQGQPRIERESHAIERLLGFAMERPNVWISSVVLEAEISRNPDRVRREDTETLLAFAHEVVTLNDGIVIRARQLQQSGFSDFDALHLACSEEARVELFLSTDDSLIRKAQRRLGQLTVRASNPLSFLQELRHADARHD